MNNIPFGSDRSSLPPNSRSDMAVECAAGGCGGCELVHVCLKHLVQEQNKARRVNFGRFASGVEVAPLHHGCNRCWWREHVPARRSECICMRLSAQGRQSPACSTRSGGMWAPVNASTATPGRVALSALLYLCRHIGHMQASLQMLRWSGSLPPLINAVLKPGAGGCGPAHGHYRAVIWAATRVAGGSGPVTCLSNQRRWSQTSACFPALAQAMSLSSLVDQLVGCAECAQRDSSSGEAVG